MAKRVDNDSTMEVSGSQVVPGDDKRRPAPHQTPGVSKNDVSMWIGGVVNADEFTGVGRKKKEPQLRWGRLVFAVLLLLALIAAPVYFFLIRPTAAKAPAPAPSTGSGSSTAPAAVIPTPPDASPDASPDAAAPPDAAEAPADAMEPTVAADAGVEPEATPPTTPGKKKPVKKTLKKTLKKKTPVRHK